jgi:DNA gyrase/topoisomerase IV subunit B
MAEDFKILSPRDHVRSRIGMYMGSSSKEQVDRFVLGKWKRATYVPALSKMIDEILDNSIDEAIRTNFKHANRIDVSIDGDAVTISDNGRGIPQDEILDAVSGEKILRPVAAWTRVNAGTSFDSERVTIGTNGVGSSATNFLSTSFKGHTWREGKIIEVNCTDGGLNIDVKRKSRHAGSGTAVTFVPDFTLFECKSLSEFDTIELVHDRLTSLQMAFPEITFSFNKNKIEVNDLKKYASLYADESATVVIEKTDNLSFFFTASDDGFRTTSFINGVNTRQGGAYVDFIVNSIVEELLLMIKKKHKVEVAKSVVKNGLTFVMFARNFTNPKFDSQTKERLTNSVGNVKEHFEASNAHDFKYIAKKLMAADDIIEPVIAAHIAKKEADDYRDAKKEQKKLKKVKVAKHIAANNDKATLCLVEGDSAMGFLLKVRDPSKIGAYPLRGVILNTWDMKPSEVLKNKELSELVAVLGLDISDPDSVDNMTYQTVATLTDSDHDGSGHISPLIVAFLYKFWPRLLEEKRVKITRSPIMISSNGKDTKWFYTYEEANTFKQSSKGYTHRYIKGLGSLTETEYDRIINQPVWDTVTVDDVSYFQLMFGSDSNLRKEFLLKDY